jgi:hypothetical protein
MTPSSLLLEARGIASAKSWERVPHLYARAMGAFGVPFANQLRDYLFEFFREDLHPKMKTEVGWLLLVGYYTTAHFVTEPDSEQNAFVRDWLTEVVGGPIWGFRSPSLFSPSPMHWLGSFVEKNTERLAARIVEQFTGACIRRYASGSKRVFAAYTYQASDTFYWTGAPFNFRPGRALWPKPFESSPGLAFWHTRQVHTGAKVVSLLTCCPVIDFADEYPKSFGRPAERPDFIGEPFGLPPQMTLPV